MIENASKENEDLASEFLTELEYHIKKGDDRALPSRTFKPSSIKCPRGAVMQVLGIEPDKENRSVNSIGITEVGSFLHQFLQGKILGLQNFEYVDVGKYVKKNKDIEVTVPCDFKEGVYETKLHSKKWNMNFLVDGLLKYKRQYMLLEIKSIGGTGFLKTKEVPEKYKAQAISYCKLLDISTVIFLFIDRDLCNMKTFMYTPSALEKENWETTMKKNLYYVENNLIPKKPLSATREFCQYCNYKGACRSFGLEEVRYESSKEL